MGRLSGSRPQQHIPPLQGELFGGSPGIATGPPQDPSLQPTPRLLAYSGDDTPLAKILGSTVEAASALKVRRLGAGFKVFPLLQGLPAKLGFTTGTFVFNKLGASLPIGTSRVLAFGFSTFKIFWDTTGFIKVHPLFCSAALPRLLGWSPTSSRLPD